MTAGVNPKTILLSTPICCSQPRRLGPCPLSVPRIQLTDPNLLSITISFPISSVSVSCHTNDDGRCLPIPACNPDAHGVLQQPYEPSRWTTSAFKHILHNAFPYNGNQSEPIFCFPRSRTHAISIFTTPESKFTISLVFIDFDVDVERNAHHITLFTYAYTRSTTG